jgi:hypothetical protein
MTVFGTGEVKANFPVKVDSSGSIVFARTAGIGVLRPFTGTAAKDPLLPRADPRRGH